MREQIRRLVRTTCALSALTLGFCIACNKSSAGTSATSAVPAASVAPAAATVPSAETAPAAAAVPPAAASAPAPATKYDVFGVLANDVLNVRAEPSVSSKKVYSFAPGVKGIVATGRAIENERTPWIEVSFEGGSGWINRLFVTEQHAGNGCDDAALTAVIRAFMRAVAANDAGAIQPLVSPIRGLSIRQAHWNPSVHIALADVPSLFTSATPRKWGKQDAVDEPIVEPFKLHMLATLQRAVAAKGAQERCGKLIMGGSAGSNAWPPEFASLTYVSFHHPGPESSNDWITWVMGMEYVDGKPYIATLVQYMWEV